MASDCHSTAVSDTPIIARAATANPIGMLPPSPRKMRAGEVRLCGRKPTQAPQRVAALTASQVFPSATPKMASPPATTAAIDGAAPSMLSNRLNALTTATTQNAVTARSIAPPAPRSHPSPVLQSSAARAISRATRRSGDTLRLSSSVPRPQSTATPKTSGSVRCQSPDRRMTATRKPPITAAPPRYGVGTPWAL